jgi:hypothetical protein
MQAKAERARLAAFILSSLLMAGAARTALAADGGLDGGVPCNPTGGGGTPGSCAAPQNNCEACLFAACCQEYAACTATGPNDPCGFGGPSGQGEYSCILDCQKSGGDLTTCAGYCTTPGCGVISAATNNLVSCSDMKCYAPCAAGAGGVGGSGGSGGTFVGGAGGVSGFPSGGTFGDAGPGYTCNPSGTAGTPGSCVGPTDNCETCLFANCCTQYAACTATNPNDACGFGGPGLDGEFNCYMNCVKSGGDQTACAGQCASQGCGTISAATNGLIQCSDSKCHDACVAAGGSAGASGGGGGPSGGASGSSGATGVCTPGATQTCFGAGQCHGAQACESDGSKWGACECGAAKPAGTSDDGGCGCRFAGSSEESANWLFALAACVAMGLRRRGR